MMKLKGAMLVLAATQASTLLAQHADAGPIVVVSHVDLSPQHVKGETTDQFLARFTEAIQLGDALLHDLASMCSVKIGCLSFQVLQQIDGPNHFTLVERWATEVEFEAQRSSARVRSIRAKLQPILGSPLDQRRHKVRP